MKSEKSSNGKIRSSGWETPAGWRHAAYVSWAVKARCHWLELRLKWEQSDEDRSQGSEHPRAKISHHWSFHVIRHQFQISRTRYLPLPGQFAVDAKGLNGGIYLFFSLLFFILQMCAARGIWPVRWVKCWGINHWSWWKANQCWPFPATRGWVFWTIFTCYGWYVTLDEMYFRTVCTWKSLTKTTCYSSLLFSLPKDQSTPQLLFSPV